MTKIGRKPSISDKTLSRLLWGGVIILVVGIPLFGVLYFLDQRVSGGPSLAQRQVASAEAAVRKDPNNIAARLNLAAAYRQAHRLDDAVDQYDEILRADKANRTALLGRATVLMGQGKLDEAGADYKAITGDSATGEFAAQDPQLQEAYYFLGEIYLKQGKLADALTQLEAALRIDRTDADAWYMYGAVLLKQGEPDKAIPALRQALLFVPTGWCEPYAQLASAYQKTNQAPQAEYAGAMVDFCSNKPDAAVRRLKTLTDGPEALDAALGLGMVAESVNNRGEAIEWYRKALALDPKNMTATTALGRLGAPVPTSSPAAKTR
jgi:tetratricopeptide (TPR) repeat protein